jgi:hypothetical protein
MRTKEESMSNVKARRAATVVVAPLAALAAWALFRAGGVSFDVSTGDGRVGASDVVVAATVAALVGWLVARALERRLERPRLWWARVGSTCLAVSIVGPSWVADGVTSVALIALHLVTAVVIIVGFAPTVPLRRRPPGYAPAGSESSARTG